MGRLTDNQVEGDVDHEYCRRVTLAYLASINYEQLTKDTH